MFKKFVSRIVDARNRDEAISMVWYGEDGIENAYENGKISLKDRNLLLELIYKMA